MISIGLPAYKDVFLKEAISSVLSQSFKDFELIIVNDCSPFNIDKIVNEFNDNRIKYFVNEKNLGKESIVDNWNRCLQYAKGDYFVLFSDDDLYQQNFLEEMYGLISANFKFKVAHCRTNIIDEHGKIIGFTPSCPQHESIDEYIFHIVNGYRRQYAFEFIYSTEYLREIGGFYRLKFAWGSDYITAIKMTGFYGILHCNKELASWRLSNHNISSVGNIKGRLHDLELYEEWLKEFCSDNIEVSESRFNKIIKKRSVKFFSDKREHLLSQYCTKISFFKLILSIYSLKKLFQLPIYKVFFNIAKSYNK